MNVPVYVIVSMAALEDLVKHAKVYDVLKYNIVNLILFNYHLAISFSL